jgi:hypothetical protein
LLLCAVALGADPVSVRDQGIANIVDCLFAGGCVDEDVTGDGAVTAADIALGVRVSVANPSTYTRVSVAGDPGSSGVFDPSVVFPDAGAAGWMAYSSVDYYVADGLVRDVTTRIAASADHGATWTLRATVNLPEPAEIAVGDISLCGQTRCSGRMISEVPFLVDDGADPDPARRFKLFAHRYFLYPPAHDRGADAQLQLGSINLRTAPSPDGPWSADVPVLGWNLAPPEIQPLLNVNTLGAPMSTCLAVSEGGAAAFDDELDVVLTAANLRFEPHDRRSRLCLSRYLNVQMCNPPGYRRHSYSLCLA